MFMRLTALGLTAWMLVFCAGPSPAEAAQGKASAEKAPAAEQDATKKFDPIASLQNGGANLAIWSLVLFIVVLLVLRKTAWGPIRDGLQKRENEIAQQIMEAQRRNDEARRLLADYEKKLADARDEVRALIEAGRRDAEKAGQLLIDKAREEAGVERQRAVQQIESATSAALKELAERSASLAVDLAGKIVGARLQAADHSRLIDQAVNEFAGATRVKVNGHSKN